MELTQQDVVVIGNPVNPGAVTEWMLIQRGIIGEALEGSIYTPQFVRVIAPNQFQLVVLPDRIQFSVLAADPTDVVAEKLGELINALPYTPYHAVGLNFVWHSSDVGERCFPLMRQLFRKDENPIHAEFDGPDDAFGGYCSKSIFGGRLRLEIHPAHKRENLAFQFIKLSFNYELQVVRDAAMQIGGFLENWNRAKIHSREMCARLEQVL
jgi:hypothetical protein